MITKEWNGEETQHLMSSDLNQGGVGGLIRLDKKDQRESHARSELRKRIQRFEVTALDS